MGAISSDQRGTGGRDIGRQRIPYRLLTKRLLLRPYEPSDTPAVRESMGRNKTHLEAWMPWARDEPKSLEEKLNWILQTRADFDLERDYSFGVFDPRDGAFIGGAGLHLRVGPSAAEIGYWIDRDRCGLGLASEATCALIQIAFENLSLERLEIHCDPANSASAAIPKRLGFHEDGVLRNRFGMPDGTWRDSQVFSLLASEYHASLLPMTALERYGALGNKLSGYSAAPIHLELS